MTSDVTPGDDPMRSRQDDVALFRGLELEEPSFEVDEAVLAAARASRRRVAAPPRPPVLVGLVSVAAALALALTWLGTLPKGGTLEPAVSVSPEYVSVVAPSSATTPSVAAAADLLAEDTSFLRAELELIARRAPEIPNSRETLRKEIEARIELCLADLEAVERRLAALRN